MVGSEGERKLAAILSADVVGYSKLMTDNEAATVQTLKEYRAAIARVIERHKGRVVNSPGDNILADFPSAVEAVQAAVEIQKVLEGRNLELADDRRMEFRIGVNLGDVIEEADGTIYGDGVNIAARMEALAEPGAICISNTIFDAVEGKLDFGFDFLGAQRVKNISKPINVYRVRTDADPLVSRGRGRGMQIGLMAAAILVVVALGALGVRFYTGGETPPAEVAEVVEEPTEILDQFAKIAVLPFENMGGDEEQAYFADGLTADVISRLSRFRGFYVIARNSTLQYKDKSVDIREVRTDLGARYVVQGNVRRAADTIRVSVEVIETEQGSNLWTETYDRELTVSNLFEIQDEIAARIAATVSDYAGVLWRAEGELSRLKPPENMDSYDCALRVTRYYDSINPEEHELIRDCSEKAIEEDPNWPGGWINAALMYLDEHRFNFNPQPGSLDRALEAARRGVELDFDLGVAHHVLAEVLFHRHELEAFFVEAERAINLNPSSSVTLASMGDKMVLAGDLERGMALVNKAVALNPNHPVWYYWPYFNYHYLKGEYQQALDAIMKVDWLDFFWTHGARAAAYGQLGRIDEARASASRLLELYPDIEANFWDDVRKFNIPDEHIRHFIEGYRKAGLDIPLEPPPATH